MSVVASPQSQSTNPLNKFKQGFLFLTIHQSRWQGHRQLPDHLTKTEIRGTEGVAGRITATRSVLMPPQWQSQFNKVYSAASRVIERYTQPFLSGISRVLPLKEIQTGGDSMSVAELFFGGINGVKAELHNVVSDFQDHYDEDVIEWNRAYWEPLLQADYKQEIYDRLPTKAELPNRFKISVSAWEMQAADFKHVPRGDIKSMLNECRKNAMADIQTGLADLIAGPREQLVVALQSLDKQLTKGQRLTPASFNEVRSAINMMRAFGEMADDDLLAQIDKLDDQVISTVQQGENRFKGQSFTDAMTPMKGALQKVMDATLEVATDAAKMAAIAEKFGVPPRALTF